MSRLELQPQVIEKIDNRVGQLLTTRRTRGEVISSAHNEGNLKNTAMLTQEVGHVYGFTVQELTLAYIAGSFHDIYRSPQEGKGLDDEVKSAVKAREELDAFNTSGFLKTTEEERNAVMYAIENHGKAPARFVQPDRRNTDPETLEEKLHTALFVADKMTANGFDVMRRRSAFVAGERLATGDLKKFGFDPKSDQDKLLVVAAESALRLGFINPQSMYPDKLKPVVDPLYTIQREYVKGVYRAAGIETNRQVAALLLGTDPEGNERKNADGETMAEVRPKKFGIPLSVEELTVALGEQTGITDTDIAETFEGTSRSARETVLFFSSHYETDLDKLTKAWEPKEQKAKEWKEGMMALIAA